MEQNILNDYNTTQCNYCRKDTQCTLEEKAINKQEKNNTYQVYFVCTKCGNENYLWREDDILKEMMQSKSDGIHKIYTEKNSHIKQGYLQDCHRLNNQILTRRKLLNKF